MMKTESVFTLSPANIAVLTLSSIISMAGFLWPFFYHGSELPRTQLFFWVATSLALILLVIQISQSHINAKSVALLGVLCALIAALRPLGAGAVGIEPMWFILILSARTFGPSFGFLLGLTSMFFSALLTGGLGPWLGYQIFAAAWIGLAGGLIPWRKTLRGRREILLLVLFGIFAAELFGILMDLQFWPWALGANTQLSYLPSGTLSENISRFITFHFATAMAWDIPRAIFTAALIALTGSPILAALRRTYTRAAFVEPIEFSERVKA